MSDFFQDLITNYSAYFKTNFQQDIYPNQDVISCKFLSDACIKERPNYVVDIGTNYGASALSMAHGLTALGRDLSDLTTIDYTHDHWNKETPAIQGKLLEEHKIDMSRIKTVCKDFRNLDPSEFIADKDAKYLVFYDIHDTLEYSYARQFLDQWVSLMNNALVGFHDMSAVPKDFKSSYPPDPRYPRTMAAHFNGQYFEGFKECETIINWLNEHEINAFFVPGTSILYFKI